MTNQTHSSGFSEGLGGVVLTFHKGGKQKQETAQLAREDTRHKLDLLQHIPECHFKQYVSDVAKMTRIPANTSLLVALGIVSSVSARCYVVQYEGRGYQPLGLYIIAEHDSGTGKSWMLSTYQSPVFSSVKALVSDWQSRKQAVEASGAEFEEPYPNFAFDTDASPEGLDETLENTRGYFALASSEQGLANSISGASYGADRKTNKDLWLKGYNAEYHSSKRAKRNGYRGAVIGSVVNIAQPGLVQTILTHSDNTGAAERCLMLSEPSLLGKRKHGREYRHYPEEYSQNVYNRILKGLAEKACMNEAVDNHPGYRLSKAGWDSVYALQNELEPHLADGGRYSTQTLRSMISKADVTIMKLAANLAIMDECAPGEIPDKWVVAAIGITHEMLEYVYHLLIDLDVIGTNAYEDSVIEYIGAKGTCTRRQFDQARRKAKPWSEITPTSAVGNTIRETLDGLIAKGIILYNPDNGHYVLIG